MKKTFNIILSIATLWVAMSFSILAQSTANKGKLKITFKNYVGREKLKLDSTIYKNELGQSFTITNFKYYVGCFHLKKKDGTEFISNDYFLIKEDDEQSKRIIFNNIPEGEYVSCDFILGVDSVHNCSGAQSGALDPANGMFWAWNTGYVFLKLEGKSDVSKSPGHIFEFHIGGHKAPVNCIRKIHLDFYKIYISERMMDEEINADVLEIMKTPITIDLSKLSSVTDFHNATTIADNYKDMFSFFSPFEK